MRADLLGFVERCERASVGRARVILPDAPTAAEAAQLSARPWIEDVAVGRARRWRRRGTRTILAAHLAAWPRATLLALAASGTRRLWFDDGTQLRSATLAVELARRVKVAVAARTRRIDAESALGRTIVRAHRAVIAGRRKAATGTDQGSVSDDVFRRFVEHARAIAHPAAPVPGRLVHANAGLVAGGTERQIVNTMLALRRRGWTDMAFVGEHMAYAKGHRFFASPLERAGIEVAALPRRHECGRDGTMALGASLANALARMPPDVADTVVDFARAFRDRRPAIVHAWQDMTAVSAGLAALAAGVPRIVLSFRNLDPTRYGVDRPHLRPALRALADDGRIRFLVNSHAGASSYAAWLGMPAARIAVVPNILDDAPLRDAVAKARAERARLGARDGALLVGGVLRFAPEKRPLLWIETAAEIARGRADARFVLFGTGPLRREAKRRAAALGLGNRLVVRDPAPEIGPALAAFDVLLSTSSVEGLPNVVLEAQAAGTPVVATKAGGTAEARLGDDLLHLVDSDRASDLASTVLGVAGAASARPRIPPDAGPFEEERAIQTLMAAAYAPMGPG